jgi:hypothetical protein
MAKIVTFTLEAEADSDDGYFWYESKRIGLGRQFLTAVDASIQAIARNPESYQVIYKTYRRAVVRRFPYASSPTNRTTAKANSAAIKIGIITPYGVCCVCCCIPNFSRHITVQASHPSILRRVPPHRHPPPPRHHNHRPIHLQRQHRRPPYRRFPHHPRPILTPGKMLSPPLLPGVK